MRYWLGMSVLVVLAAHLSYGETPSKSLTVHHVLVAVLAKDAARASDIERGVTDDFVGRGIPAEGLHAVFASTVPVSEMQEQIRARDYDDVLCMTPRKTIRMPTDASKKISSLKTCLAAYATGKLPSGEPLEVNPFNIDGARLIPPTGPDPLGNPIPTNPNAAHFRLNKRTLQLFDVRTGKLVWEKEVQVKVPADIQEGLEIPLLVHGIWEAIETSGILPKP